MGQMLDFLWSVGGYFLAVAVLVSFHEFGHFWVARRLGVKVLRYSIGFGRPLWRRVGQDGTEYVVAAPPEHSVAARAGLQAGDRIETADGQPIVTWSALRTLLISHALNRKPMTMTVVRGHDPARQVQMVMAGVRVDPEFMFDDLGLHAYQPPLPPVLSEVLPNS